MLKGHPKGLYVAFLTNMGERFGFYTMMAILIFFLQARYNLNQTDAGIIYSIFYFMIYALALVGGLVADYTGRYKTVILVGIILMFAGYGILAFPGSPLWITIVGLGVIAAGNGMFKGNLQAVVGKLYDDPKYSHLRDSAFSVFYMGINVGALFAPAAASAIGNWMLRLQGFIYQPNVSELCQKVIADPANSQAATELQALSAGASATGQAAANIGEFASNYLNAITTGYNGAFGIAAAAMVISLLVYLFFNRALPAAQKKGAVGAANVPQMSRAEEKQRLTALFLVFVVVIFFWMSFHQNGVTMSYFARDYTQAQVSPGMNMVFDLSGLLPVVAVLYGLVLLLQSIITTVKSKLPTTKAIIALVLLGVGGYFAQDAYGSFISEAAASASGAIGITPQIFQQFNPLFIVFLTPVVVGFFAWLNRRKVEPSTPKKIGIGMILAALGFFVLMISSLGLPSQAELGNSGISGEVGRVSPNWLIGTYLILTFAELFLSPMGLSFVSKVAPPRMQGLMQGCWLGATALGNSLLFVGAMLYQYFDVWMVWTFFVVCCLVSAAFVFSIMKKLESATGGK